MEEINPKISVIMPSLNVEDYITQCMKSVLNQTLDDIEVICIDANSTDDTGRILGEFAEEDERVRLLNTDRRSYGYQVNCGIQEACGEYISIIETDDFIDENMFKTLYGMSQDGTVDIVKSNFYNLYEFNDKTSTLSEDVAKAHLSNRKSFTLREEPLFIEGHPSIWSAIYRREFLADNNIKLLEEPGGGWVDNPFFYQTAILAESIKYTPQSFYYYRKLNPNSSSNTFTTFTLPMKRILDIFDIFERYGYPNDDVKILFYNRLFRYIEIILENNDNNPDNLDPETRRYIYDVLQKVDRKVVKDNMHINFRKIYFKYSSPLFIK